MKLKEYEKFYENRYAVVEFFTWNWSGKFQNFKNLSKSKIFRRIRIKFKISRGFAKIDDRLSLERSDWATFSSSQLNFQPFVHSLPSSVTAWESKIPVIDWSLFSETKTKWRKEGQLWPHSVQTTSKMRPLVLEAKALWSPTTGLPAGLLCPRLATNKATHYNLLAIELSKMVISK